jgi:hypothetical protein
VVMRRLAPWLAMVALAGCGQGGGGDDAARSGPVPAAPSGTANATQAARHCRPAPTRTHWRVGHWPSACWRPYSKQSPFNRPLPAHPHLARDSARLVGRFAGLEPAPLVAGADLMRWGFPTYWSTPRDPVFRLHCTMPWGRCAIEGMRIRVPDAARWATGSDGHMTVVDQRTGWEYDFWRVQRKSRGGGTLDTAWGGRTRIDGSGLGSDATAARFGNLAGLLRAEELAAGRIDHALFITVPCDSGTWVYPASKNGTACSRLGESNVNATPMGTRFRLDMSNAEINALAAPLWEKALLRAMARYGMYVGDTGGREWGIEQEGSQTYTSFGYPDRWTGFARSAGAAISRTGTAALDVLAGVDWRRRLQVVAPCEARGTC